MAAGRLSAQAKPASTGRDKKSRRNILQKTSMTGLRWAKSQNEVGNFLGATAG
jgi:hypothetical protein